MADLDLTAADFKARGRGGRSRGGAAAPPQGQPARSAYPGQSRSAAAVADRARKAHGARAARSVIAAKGGLERCAAIKSITATTRAQATTPDGPVSRPRRRPISSIRTTCASRPRCRTRRSCRSTTAPARGCAIRTASHDVPERMSARLRERASVATRSRVLLAAVTGSVRARLLPDVKDDDGHACTTPWSSRAPNWTRWCCTSTPTPASISKQTYVAGGVRDSR